MLSRQAADFIATEARKAIVEAFKKNDALKHWDVLDAGGSLGFDDFNLKLKFVDSTAKPLNPLGGEQTDMSIKRGLAAAGTKILFRGKRYTVVAAKVKNYQAIGEEDGRRWSLPFAGCSLVAN
jgi:hypothetical protein